jgi:uncharacterized protein (DUF2141 family)
MGSPCATADRGAAPIAPALLVGALLVAVFGGVLGSDVAAQPSLSSGAGLGDPEAPHRLLVTVMTRSDDGRVFCGLWRGRDGYPTVRERAVGQALDRTVVEHRATCVFEDVSPGEYAIAVFHDENANNDLDRNIFGVPSEGTGASNDAWNMFGPPGYDDARFEHTEAREQRLTVHIRY